MAKYQRVLLKLSGEALIGGTNYGISPKILDYIASQVKQILELGTEVGIVIGGGNFFRGHILAEAGIGRITADHMGMLGTIINSLALRDAFERAGLPSRIMSAIPMSGIVDHYDRRKAMYFLKEGRVVFFSAGTGNPLVTTDSAASLRAIEIEADILLKATNVDGIYCSDPKKNLNAKMYSHISFNQALKDQIGVMDISAFCQCRDHKLPIRVFNLNRDGALKDIILGKEVGTLVDNNPD